MEKDPSTFPPVIAGPVEGESDGLHAGPADAIRAARLSPAEKGVALGGLALLALLLALVFNAYLSPHMLFDFANMLLCS